MPVRTSASLLIDTHHAWLHKDLGQRDLNFSWADQAIQFLTFFVPFDVLTRLHGSIVIINQPQYTVTRADLRGGGGGVDSPPSHRHSKKMHQISDTKTLLIPWISLKFGMKKTCQPPPNRGRGGGGRSLLSDGI